MYRSNAKWAYSILQYMLLSSHTYL
jgi:hypothetical protein